MDVVFSSGFTYRIEMSETAALNISRLTFTSAVFPTADDIALWDSLSDSEKYALIMADEAQGFESGYAEDESLEARLNRVRHTPNQ